MIKVEFNLDALATPETHDDFMALASEALTEINHFRALLAHAVDEQPCAETAE